MADFVGCVYYFFQGLGIDGGSAVAPPLEGELRLASTFTTVLWQSTLNKCDVLVVEAPGAEHLEPGLFGSC